MVIYKITNNINKKSLISYTFKKTQKEVLAYWMRNCGKKIFAEYEITKDVKKYGKSVFYITSLEEIEDSSESFEIIDELIDTFNTLEPDGYNKSYAGIRKLNPNYYDDKEGFFDKEQIEEYILAFQKKEKDAYFFSTKNKKSSLKKSVNETKVPQNCQNYQQINCKEDLNNNNFKILQNFQIRQQYVDWIYNFVNNNAGYYDSEYIRYHTKLLSEEDKNNEKYIEQFYLFLKDIADEQRVQEYNNNEIYEKEIPFQYKDKFFIFNKLQEKNNTICSIIIINKPNYCFVNLNTYFEIDDSKYFNLFDCNKKKTETDIKNSIIEKIKYKGDE